jgi:hypothetical protein
VARFESMGESLNECNKVIISPVEAAAYEQVALIPLLWNSCTNFQRSCGPDQHWQAVLPLFVFG